MGSVFDDGYDNRSSRTLACGKSGELVHRTFANRWPHGSASRDLKRLARRNRDFAAAVTCASGGVLTIEPSKSGPLQHVEPVAGFIVPTIQFEKPEPGLRPMPQPVNRGNGRRGGVGLLYHVGPFETHWRLMCRWLCCFPTSVNCTMPLRYANSSLGANRCSGYRDRRARLLKA